MKSQPYGFSQLLFYKEKVTKWASVNRENLLNLVLMVEVSMLPYNNMNNMNHLVLVSLYGIPAGTIILDDKNRKFVLIDQRNTK